MKAGFKTLAAIAAFAVTTALGATTQQDTLRRDFVRPPDAARPWVYWFWLNGNLTKEGITADLEAMKRVGIGGVLIMEVDQGAPVGPVDFASPKWRELFQFVCSEAHRLGLEVNMNDDAGWNGSGGPWITPDKAMQKVVWTETTVEGPKEFGDALTQPETVANYYRDIEVVAFPATGDYRIPDIAGKTGLGRQDFPAKTSYGNAPADSIVNRSNIVDLTDKLGADGKLHWSVPAGRWTIMRIGHTLTGSQNGPAPLTGTGLECDKLSKEGSQAAFDGLMAKLIADNGPLVGKSLVRTHIDSWENGSQNWTAKFPEEFKRRRGYDIRRFMPVFAGRVVDSLETSERFLWDVRQTIGELVADYYAGNFEKLAKQHGIQLSIEAYGNCVFDDIAYGGRADEPMAEFWSWPGNFTSGTVYEMASSAHVYGKRILGAEAFTATDGEKWQHHPATIKGLGDWAFCRGINRFVFHRYAMQPWLNYAPGMSMGPWGLHYERTETWWELSEPWHRYLARCQYMLRQGVPVVDLLYVAPEEMPSSYNPPQGAYRADSCPAEVVEKRLKVKNGRLVLPDGMSYQALVLPNTGVMTPALLSRLGTGLKGATIIGGKAPTKAPGLLMPDPHMSDNTTDQTIADMASRVWQSGVIQSKDPDRVLAAKGIPPDFASNRGLDYIHRTTGREEIYFVANPHTYALNAECKFRVTGKQPEFWHPENGRVQMAPIYSESGGVTTVPLHLEQTESVFVVFRQGPSRSPVKSVAFGGKQVWPPVEQTHKIQIQKATWGPEGDAARTKDVTDQVKQKLAHADSFVVAELVDQGDPAVNVIKTLHVDYQIDGRKMTASATDPEKIEFTTPSDAQPTLLLSAPGVAEVSKPGTYEWRGRLGEKVAVKVADWEKELPVRPAWTLAFPFDDTVQTITTPKLISWSDLDVPDMKYFSGTAVYSADIEVPRGFRAKGRRIYLDLGRVEIMAQVTLNGKDLGILWRAPYKVDVTYALQTGTNHLVIRITNQWINRMIGDEQLPEDSDRYPGGNLKSWPDWVQQGKPSPTGRKTFTDWRLWHKDDKLFPAGLLGPVVLRANKIVTLGPTQTAGSR